MARIYTVTGKVTGVTTAATIVLLTAAAGKSIQVINAMLTNSSNTTSQQTEACLQCGTVTGTAPTGTAATVGPHYAGWVAPTTTALQAPTDSGVTYDSTQFGLAGFNAASGWAFAEQSIPQSAHGTGPITVAGGVVALKLTKTLSTASDIDYSITIRELDNVD